MAKTPKEYQRLPGRGSRLDGNRLVALSRSVCTLWLGADHLLLVDRTGYTENYKRFYFRDIQAVVMRRTNSRAAWSSGLSVPALLFFLWALAVGNLPGKVTLCILGGFFAILALVNFLRGPTCVSYIKTPVQTEQLPSLNRVRTAQKAMERIRPLLLEAQGAFFPDELKAELENRLRPVSQTPPTGTP